MILIHLLIHWAGIDYGLPYGHWSWYNFWSGIGGSFLASGSGVALAFYVHHTCQSSWKCFRPGRYPAANGKFKLCKKHHPDHQGKTRLQMIHELHWAGK